MLFFRICGLIWSSFDQSLFRSLRVIRPLKIVTKIPTLKLVTMSIVNSFIPLLEIGILLFFVNAIYAMAGVAFYKGIFHAVCVDNKTNIMVRDDEGEGKLCTPVGCSNCCDENEVCRFSPEQYGGPRYGLTSFDNFGFAMLNIFQCITFDGWSDMLYQTNAARDWPTFINVIFYVTVIIIGNFFMLNLVLGVLSGHFTTQREKLENRRQFLKMTAKMKINQALDGYLDWISKAEELILEDVRTTMEERNVIMKARRRATREQNKIAGIVEEQQKPHDMADEKIPNSQNYFREKKFRHRVKKFMKSHFVFWLTTCVVFLNTFFLALEHSDEPEWLALFFWIAEQIFICFFIVEMVLKLYSYGPQKFFSNYFNTFDLFVVVGGVIELGVEYYDMNLAFGFSVLRCTRLLKIYKYTRFWQPLRNLALSVIGGFKVTLSLLFLLILFIIMFALLGVELFGGRFAFGEEPIPDGNFNTFLSAWVTVFQIISGTDWSDVMVNGIRALGMWSSLYFIVLTLFGSYVLLNVFLAIAVDNLANAQEMTIKDNEEKEQRMQVHIEEELLHASASAFAASTAVLTSSSAAATIPKEVSFVLPNEVTTTAATNNQAGDAASEDIKDPIVPFNSMFIFSPTNPIRRIVHYVVTSKMFKTFIMTIIILSSLALAIEDPVNADSTLNNVLSYFDIVIATIFTLEMALLMIDLGVILHRGSYFRSGWNIFDFVIVVCSLLYFIILLFPISGSGKTILKSVRVLRVLRPLKVVKILPGLKIVIDCVISSIENGATVLVVYGLVQFMFIVMGVQLYEGRLSYCTDESIYTAIDCQGQFYSPDKDGNIVVQDRQWLRYALNFDNFFQGMLTLFVLQTLDMWPTVNNYLTSSQIPPDLGPVPDINPQMAIYSIMYIVVIPFFLLKLFIALTIVTFQGQGEEELEKYDITNNQKKCIEFILFTKLTNLHRPRTKGWRYLIWRLVVSDGFDMLILVIIIGSTVLCAIDYVPSSATYKRTLDILNAVFTFLFALEVILKFFAFTFKGYLSQAWNVFDLITVVGSFADVFLSFILPKYMLLKILRIFRVLRIIKLLNRSSSTRTLLWTFMQSFKSMPYVFLLLLMLFFIFAVTGMQFFGSIELNPDTEINVNNNFQNIGMAFLALFRCATGEKWSALMFDCVGGQNCEPTSEEARLGITCGSDISYLYFVSFVLLCSLLMLNLFVAVIMDNFDYLTGDCSLLGPHSLSDFACIWIKHDPNGTGKVHYKTLYKIMTSLSPPLGFGIRCSYRLAYRKLIKMNIPVDKDKNVNFRTILMAFVRENTKLKTGTAAEMDKLDNELRHMLLQIWPKESQALLNELVPTRKDNWLTTGTIYAGLLILENFLRKKRRRERSNEKTYAHYKTSNQMIGYNNQAFEGDDINDLSNDRLPELKEQYRHQIYKRMQSSSRRSLESELTSHRRNVDVFTIYDPSYTDDKPIPKRNRRSDASE